MITHDPLYVAEYVRLNYKTKTVRQMAKDSGIPIGTIERRLKETGRRAFNPRHVRINAKMQ